MEQDTSAGKRIYWTSFLVISMIFILTGVIANYDNVAQIYDTILGQN